MSTQEVTELPPNETQIESPPVDLHDETTQQEELPPPEPQQIHHDSSADLTHPGRYLTEPASAIGTLQPEHHPLPHEQQHAQAVPQFMEVDENHLVMDSRKRERAEVDVVVDQAQAHVQAQAPAQGLAQSEAAEDVLTQVQPETEVLGVQAQMVQQVQPASELMNGLQQPQTQLHHQPQDQTENHLQPHPDQVQVQVEVDVAPTTQVEDNDMVGTAAKRARLNVPPTTSVKRKSVPPPKKLNNEQWDAMFERLVQYKNQHGDCLVPKRYQRDPKLGTWVETQRVQYKKLQAAIGSTPNASATPADPNDPTPPVVPVTPNKRLNAERLERLESIGFAWSAKNLRKPKQGNINNSGAVANSNSGNPSGNHEIGTTTTVNPQGGHLPANNDSNSIGAITATNTTSGPKRRSVSSNTATAADAAHKAQLRQQANDKQWADMYDRLEKYKAAHGDCLVPKKYEQDPKLAAWVETQRVLYNRDFRKSGNINSVAATAIANKQEPGRTAVAVNGTTTVATAEATVQGAQVIASVPSPQGKSPEDWAMEIDAAAATTTPVPASQAEQGGATAEDAAEVAATMEAATMEVVEQVVPTETAAASSPPEHPTNPEDVTTAPMDGVALTTDTPNQLPAPAPVAGNGKEDDPVGAPPPVTADTTAVATVTVATASKKPESVLKRLTQERKDKLEALGFVWSLRNKRVDDHWDEMFNQLVEYKEKHGDCLVPSRFEENFKLGKWVETQRYEYTKLQRAVGQTEVKSDEAKLKEGGENGTTAPTNKTRPTNPRLTEERLRRLEAIGFEWKVKHKMKRYYDRQWDTMFEKLLKYKEVNGHCLVPKRYPPDMKLGTWVHTQRIQYRKFLAGTSKKDGATSDSGGGGIEDASGHTANDDTKSEDNSTKAMGEDNSTKAAGEENSVEAGVEENSTNAGGEENSTKAGAEADEVSFRLTEDRRKRLEEAGFVWSAREVEKSSEPHRITRNSYDDQWDSMLERLKKFKEKHGDCLVPKRCKEDPKLGTWVDTQRVQYKKMIKHLAKQGIDWNGPGPAKIDGSDSNTGASKPVVGRLTDDRIRRLEDIGFVWSLRDDWQKHYEELIEYKKVHGHCNVPARYQTNRRLGIWVSAQRQQFKIMNMPEELKPRRSAPLTLDRIKLLNVLGFTWTIRSRDSLGESWNQRLDELRKYREEHGNCLVPSRYPPNPELGVWVGTQRTQYRLYQRSKELGTVNPSSAAMSEDRIRQLEELGFVWALRGGSDSFWRKRVGELVDYRAKYGNSDVSSKYKENAKLGSWVNIQRLQYKLVREGKGSSLDDEKIAELDSLGFTWEEPDEATAILGVAPPTIEGAESAEISHVLLANAITAADEMTGVHANSVTAAGTVPVAEGESSAPPGDQAMAEATI